MVGCQSRSHPICRVQRTLLVCAAIAAVAPLTLPKTSVAAIAGFVETFNGDGQYTSSITPINNLDNPSWEIETFGGGHLQLTGGALSIQEAPMQDELGDGHRFTRGDLGSGSFRYRIALNDLRIGDVPGGSPATSGRFFFRHYFDSVSRDYFVWLSMSKDPETNEMGVGIAVDEGPDTPPRSLHGIVLPELSNLSLIIEFDASTSSVQGFYDVLDDQVEPIPFGPAETYRGILAPEQSMELVLGGGHGGLELAIDRWSFLPLNPVPGDFTGDMDLNLGDLRLLETEVSAGTITSEFDLTDDNLVNEDDLRFWITDLKRTYFGDANLDGEFASSDLVNIFLAGEYEDDIEGNSTWAEGDWNSDADFTSSDLVLAFVEGGYEQGPRAAVPEPPPCAVMLGIAMLPRRRT